jgi:hypothetical protein
MLKKIFTAITALAVVASLLVGTAGTAAAATGYNSAYFGESAFLTLAPGASGQFAVGFNNTGSTGWLVGSASQVDLSICLADKLTCNVTSPNAAFASGWLSSTAYATTSTTYVGPGQTGFFVYNVAAPSAAAAGTYRFNGDLALHNTASMINQQGYYQDSDVAQPGTAPVLTSLTPNTGSNAGGTSIAIAGTGFTCNPTLPTVNFDPGNAGTVTSCGASSLTVTSPAHASATVSLTVNNAGGAASNGLSYIFADTTGATFNSVTATGIATTLTFSEPVCRNTATFAASDYSIAVNGVPDAATSDTAPLASPVSSPTNCVTSYDVTVATAFTNGDNVAVTLTATGAAKIQDVSGNVSSSQTRTATATGDTTKPFMTAAAATAATTLKLTYSEAVTCAAVAAATQFVVTPPGGAPGTGTSAACIALPAGSTTVTVTFGAGTFTSGVSGSVLYTEGANPILDRVGNHATTPQTIAFTAFTTDAARPLSQDIRITTKSGSSSTLNIGDVFTVAFNKVMLTPTVAGAKISLSDADLTAANVTCVAGNATCILSTTVMTIGGIAYPVGQVITVTMTGAPVITNAGTSVGLQIPATVYDSLGFTDASANSWDIANSLDKTLN